MAKKEAKKTAGKKSAAAKAAKPAKGKTVKGKSSKGGASNPLQIMDTTLRDGHQSLLATRMRLEDMIPIMEKLNAAGFAACEVWGGATFDATHRFLNEDPWERLAVIRKHMPDTKLQMLLRGQNLVGYRHYADDVVDAFVEQTAETGLDVFRVFDALNDERNMERSFEAIKKTGKHIQATLCYTLTERRLGGPIYNIDYYLDKARTMAAMGADSICVKDMAGLLAPQDAYDLVAALKDTVDVPIQLHCHYTSGMASMAYLKAIEAGVDIVDCSLAPFALRTSQPAMEPIIVALEGSERDTGIELEPLNECSAHIEKVFPKYRDKLDQSRMAVIDAGVLLHQIPGGMRSNLTSQLIEAGALDKIDEVFKELPRTRADMGYPPLVTPSSQIVGTQAVMNVLFGRYKQITQPVKDYMAGLYGRPPVAVDKKVQKLCLEGHKFNKPIKGRPADSLDPELDKAREAVKDITTDIKDVLIYAIYPTTGMQFLRWKHGLEEPPPEVCAKSLAECELVDEMVEKAKKGLLVEPPEKGAPEPSDQARTFNVTVDGEPFEVVVDPVSGPMVSGPPVATAPARPAPARAPAKPAAPSAAPPPKSSGPAASASQPGAVAAPMPGIIIEYKVREGDKVQAGDVLLILEAMKMQNEIKSSASGVVASVSKKDGDKVVKGEAMLVID